MRLVEEEDELGLVGVAHLGQFLEQFRQKPQQEGCIEPGRGHQLVSGQDIDPPPPIEIGAHEIGQFQRRFPEQPVAPLPLQHQKPPLDRADRGGRDISVAQGQRLAILAHPDQERLKILEIEQRQPLFVGHAEGDVQDALLRLAQFQKPRQQQGAHLGHGRAHRVARFAIEVPEGDREGGIGVIGKSDLRGAFHEGVMQLEALTARRTEARQVPFHVRQEDRHPVRREAFGQDLQGHGLARPGRPGDQPVPVGIFQQQLLCHAVILAAATDKKPFAHHLPLKKSSLSPRHNTILTILCQPDVHGPQDFVPGGS